MRSTLPTVDTGNPFRSFWRKRAPNVVFAIGPSLAYNNPYEEDGDSFRHFGEKCDRYVRSCDVIGDGNKAIHEDEIVETMAGQPEGSLLIAYIHGKIEKNRHVLLMGQGHNTTPMERLLTRITEESGGKTFDYAFLSCRAGINHKLADSLLPEGSLCLTLAENRKITTTLNSNEFLETIDSPMMRTGVSLDRMLLAYLLERTEDLPAISLTGTGLLSLPNTLKAHLGKPFTAEESSRIESRFSWLDPDDTFMLEEAKIQIERNDIDDVSARSHYSVILAAMGDPAKAMRPLSVRRPE